MRYTTIQISTVEAKKGGTAGISPPLTGAGFILILVRRRTLPVMNSFRSNMLDELAKIEQEALATLALIEEEGALDSGERYAWGAIRR